MALIEKIFHRVFVKPVNDRLHEAAVSAIRERGVARVALITSSLSMWRLEGVWRLMQEDKRFDCRIILVPFAKLSPKDKEFELGKLRRYFDEKSIRYYEQDTFTEFDPDIIFYQQFYSHSYKDPVRACHNENKLIVYAPYGVMFIDKKWQYDSRFHRRGWKIYMQSEAHKQTSRRLCANSAENVVVVGDADSDAFAAPSYNDPWKSQPSPVKRVIWAPHQKNLGRDSFDWAAQEMKNIANEYAGRIQFAFKPHPRLKTELMKDPQWGPEKTEAFYNFWAQGDNTQLETGGFVELFRSSDAMIHDCNSFIAEYLYTNKPVLFLSANIQRIRSSFSRFGQDSLDAHYLGDRKESIRDFLDNVVLGGKDPKASKRENCYSTYLKPSGSGGFAESIVRDMADSIFTGLSGTE